MASKQKIWGYAAPAVAAARIADVLCAAPSAEQVVLWRSPGGPVHGGYLRVSVDRGQSVQGEVIGVYRRDVTLQQLIEDIGA